MPELSPLPDTPLGRYRHCKGGEHEVIGVARHSETNEALVVYRPLYNATGAIILHSDHREIEHGFDGR